MLSHHFQYLLVALHDDIHPLTGRNTFLVVTRNTPEEDGTEINPAPPSNRHKWRRSGCRPCTSRGNRHWLRKYVQLSIPRLTLHCKENANDFWTSGDDDDIEVEEISTTNYEIKALQVWILLTMFWQQWYNIDVYVDDDDAFDDDDDAFSSDFIMECICFWMNQLINS